MRRTRFESVLILAAVTVPLAVTPAVAQDLDLRLSVEHQLGASTTTMLQEFGDLLTEKLGDEVAIEVFHSGQLGDEIVHMEQVRTGQIDVYPLGSDAIVLDETWAIFDTPFLFSDREQVARVLDGPIGDELKASMREKAGLEVLSFGEIGFRHITNNVRPIVVPADLDGVKLRVPGSKTRILTFETLGAAPITMNYGELYLAMEQGVVDGQENPLAAILTSSFYEVQDYTSMSKHVYTPITFVMNARRYDSLTDEQRQAVDEAAQEAALASRERGAALDAELVEKINEASGGSMAFNEIDSAAFQAAAEPVWVAIGEIAGPELMERVVEAVKQ
ncbi:MAG: TRAP transporter substrate-binding protein [Pseudomonadota bacterium]